MPTTTITRDELDQLLSLHAKMIKAQIDAGACGTRTDFRRAHEAEESYYDAYEAVSVRIPEF